MDEQTASSARVRIVQFILPPKSVLDVSESIRALMWWICKPTTGRVDKAWNFRQEFNRPTRIFGCRRYDDSTVDYGRYQLT